MDIINTKQWKRRLARVSMVFLVASSWAGERDDEALRQHWVIGQAALEDSFFETAEKELRQYLVGLSPAAAAARAEASHLYLQAVASQEKFEKLLVLLSDAPPWLGRKPPALHAFWRAYALHRLDQHEDAATLLLGLTQDDATGPLGPMIMRLLAACMLDMGNTQEAGRLYREFDKVYSDNVEAGQNLMDLARLLISEENYVLAGDVLTRLLLRAENTLLNQEARYWLGRVLAAQGHMVAATNVLGAVVQEAFVNPDLAAECWYALGGAQLGLNLADKALESFDLGIKVAHEPALRRKGKRLLGTVHIQEKNFDEGIRILKEVVQENPVDPDASRMQLLVAQALSSQGRFLLALNEYQHYLESFPNEAGRAQAYLEKAHILSRLERHGEAANTFEKAYAFLNVDEDRARAQYLAGQSLLKDRQYRRAQEAFLAVCKNHAGSSLLVNAGFELARSQMLAGELSAAELTFMSLTTNHPSHALAGEALLQVAEMKWQAGELAASTTVFTTFLNTYTNSPGVRRAWLGRGLVRYQSGLFREALMDFNQARRGDISDEDAEHALYLSGLCHFWLDDGEKAVNTENLFMTTYTNSPYAPRAHFWLAKYAFNEGNYAKAESSFVSYFKTYPDSRHAQDALLWAGRSALKQKEYIRAVERLGELAKAFPEGARVPEARFEQGNALCELAKFSEAILVFQEIINKHPGAEIIAETWLRTGDCQFMLGVTDKARYDESIAAYKKCVQSPFADSRLMLEAQYKIGRCLQKQGDIDGAVEQYYQNVIVAFLDPATTENRMNEPSRMWFWRAAREAAAILEQQGEWRKAVGIMERVLDVGVPADAVMRTRIRDIKVARWWEFY